MAAHELTAAKDYFGYCILPDKTGAPIFQQLLYGIHEYIAKHVAPFEIKHLTPAKLAHFYRLVGGNFDRLFLESPPASLSFVYSSLGCQHTLHQEQNLFEPPTIPALTAQGFIRWQTIQTLLAPAEHVPYIQAAVKRFEMVNPGPGGPFPKVFPAECLPVNPDMDMVQWHDGVGRRLRNECVPRSRPASARGDVAQDNHFNPPQVRRRPHIHTSTSPTSRRYSSSDTREDRLPKSPHPLRQARRYQRASVESETSDSSGSESPPSRSTSNVKSPERSPRSQSAVRNPYLAAAAAAAATSPNRHSMARRHSAQGIDNRLPVPSIRETLSPQFYPQQGGISRQSSGASPPNVALLPPRKSATVPGPQGPVRGHRHTVSHSSDRSRDASWRDKLTAYIGLTSDSGRRNDTNEAREVDRDMEKDRRNMDPIRYVEGVGGIPMDRRRLSPGRGDVEDDDNYHDSHRRPRRGRRASIDEVLQDKRPVRA